MGIVCQECPARCCEAVKRLPYLGEGDPVALSTLLLGAVADDEPPDPGRPRRPVVVEWIVPGEAPCCPAYTADGLCSIHPHRPLACRRFPVTSQGGFHPFCPHPKEIGGEPWEPVPLEERVARLDAHLLNLLAAQGSGAAGAVVGEEDLLRMPLLYNGYLLAVLLMAGVDLERCLKGQREVLHRYRVQGLEELTYRIPDTDYAVSAAIQGLEANLAWLKARMEEWGMAVRVAEGLRKAGIPLP